MAGTLSEGAGQAAHAIHARLAAWELTVETDRSQAPAVSKNRTILCRHRSGRRVLVKVAESDGGVVREGDILQRLTPVVQRRSCPLGLPKVVAMDRALGLLAIEWMAPSETLHAYHRRTGKYGASIAEQLGRGLGFLHRISRERRDALAAEEGPPGHGDLLECFVRMRPDFYARLSPAGIELFARIQSNGPALQALQALSLGDSSPAPCLLHGDVRQANLLRIPRGKGHALVFLDWELAFWGDPARDVGSILADYAMAHLAPEREEEAIGSRSLKALARALLSSYRRERGRAFPPDEGFERRVVQWLSVAVLTALYGITHYEGDFGARPQRLTELAAEMLAAPERWARALWGAG